MEKFNNDEIKVLTLLLFLIVNECSLRFRYQFMTIRTFHFQGILFVAILPYLSMSFNEKRTHKSLPFLMVSFDNAKKGTESETSETDYYILLYSSVDISFINVLCQ